MTSLVAVDSARSRTALSVDAVALGALALLAVGLAVATWGTWGDLDADTGYDFVSGAGVAGGQIPYVDFPYWYGPLAPALLGVSAWLGGGGIGPFVAFGLGLSAAIMLATYALARAHAGPLGAAFATAITATLALAPTTFGYVLPHVAAAPLGLLCLLGMLLALGRASGASRDRWLLAAGACAGLSTLTKPEFATASLAAAVAWLLLDARGAGAWRRSLALLAAPAAAIPGAVYGAFLTAVPLHTLLFENLYPADFLGHAGNTLLRARAPVTPASFAELGGRLVLYAAGVAALLLLARALARPGRVGRWALAGSGGFALLAAAASIANPEALRYGLQFAWGWIPAGAALAGVALVVRFRRHPGARTGGEPAELAGLAALVAFASTTYAGFFLYATNVQTAVYIAPLAAIFVARLHLVELARSRHVRAVGLAWLAFLLAAGIGLTLKDARAESAAVSGPGGTLRETPDKARAFRAAVGEILARSRPGERILLAPQLSWLYALSGRENALAEVVVLPGTFPDAPSERAAIDRLEHAGVRLAVIDRRSFAVFGHTSFGRSFDPLLARWLERNFVLVITATGAEPGSPVLEVWQRRVP
jgi:hypothetical protein